MSLNKTLAIILLAAPCRAAEVSRARQLMGTVCEIRAEASHAQVTAAFNEIARWEQVLSLFRADSELSRLNSRMNIAQPASPSLYEAVALAKEMARRTGGAFDPTLKPQGWATIELDAAARTIRLRHPLDLNGIGKGLALDHAAARLPGRALLNFGGQLLAKGRWKVETADGFLYIEDESLSASGNEEQPGHIKNPLTGKSVYGRSRRVIAKTGWEADALSTAAFVQENTKGEKQHEDRSTAVGAGPAR